MLRRAWKSRVSDVLEAIQRIQRYTDGLEFEAFASDEKTIDAVLRNVTIIGEAATHVPVEVQDRYPQVPWAEMRGIRNLIIHEYFGVSLPILWETIQRDLPQVRQVLERILEEQS